MIFFFLNLCSKFFKSLSECQDFYQVHVQVLFQTVIVELCCFVLHRFQLSQKFTIKLCKGWNTAEGREKKERKMKNFINIWLFIQIFLLKAASVKISTLLMPCRYVNMLNNWLNSEILCFDYCFHLQEGFKIA